MTKILFRLGLCWGWSHWNGGGGFFLEKSPLRKSDPALNGTLVRKESYGRGYLPDSPSVLS